jgi:ATP-dependent RNA helicase RhlE
MEKQTFSGLNIKPEILEVLGKLNFTVPTPIQIQAIPVATEGNDVIGIAQTGTGKTLAFGVPTIQKLISSQQSALIILPTRELALQVDEAISRIARHFNLHSAVLIGGQNMAKQMRDLRANPRIIISTPGRLIDHLERKTVRLDRVGILVLDEADRMLDMGFAPQVKRILQEVPKERQTMLFSATMPKEIVGLANQYMKTPLRVEVAPAGSATDNVSHEIFFVRDGSKLALLETILKEKRGSILIFSRTKFGAKKIAFAVRKMGYTSTEIHSNRTLAQRMAALDGFKRGKFQVMVATDIAARGIDVKGIEIVINYDLPDSPEDYVHRIGRTGRAENLGHAISFATPKQTYDIRIIERLIKKTLPVSKLPELLKLDPSIMEGGPERGGRDNDNHRSERSFGSPSRGRSASGSRYSRNARPNNSERSESQSGERAYAPSNSNDRRGFLKKRPQTATPYKRGNSNERSNGERSFASAPSYAPKKNLNDNFYKESFFNSTDYKGSDRREDDRRPERSNDFKDRQNSYARSDSYKPGEKKSFGDKPFVSSGDKPYQKPFGSRGKFGAKRSGKQSQFGRNRGKAFAGNSR